ncbi:MAG: DNA translocase FtsK [Spirochaetaceae bacterium]|jgi:S-DNA-T family DNA segregation ATPase FtsK/SpoIIIE|nr:DNA translocase FtsK [Spirochaetaceae bacterium]
MTLSIAGALFRGSEGFFGLGNFFVDALGILAFGIPGYLLCAALLLASPVYRPDRIFILSCSLVPFVTLSMGFVFLRDFEYWSQEFGLFYWIGKGGFNLFVILLTIIEGLIIVAFTSTLFPQAPEKEEEMDEPPDEDFYPERMPQKSKLFWQSAKDRASQLVPEVFKRKPAEPDSQFPPPSAEDVKTFDSEEIDLENLRLPDLKPLASASAMSKWEALSSQREDPIPQDVHPEYWEEETREETISASWENYQVPFKGILNGYPAEQADLDEQSLRDAAMILKETLRDFNIQAEIIGIWKGPAVSMFETIPEPGVKLPKIINLQDNLALRLAVPSIRIVAPIPGSPAVGIEVPNEKRSRVFFADLIREEAYWGDKKMEIPLILGREITGRPRIIDLVQIPHLLIAGAEGSGKSVCLNSLILSMLYRLSPAKCRFILIDLKITEFKVYNDIPHLLTPVITESKRALQALQYCLDEMERRYACLNSLEVRDIRSYNKRIRERGIAVEHLPYIVVIIDEFADLMTLAGKELESALARLAAMSRAVGIHLILSTQHPSIDIITGKLKANIPGRVAFMVANKIDSRLILDAPGAEKLLGKGDMLYAGSEDAPARIQGAYISQEEAERAAEYVKTLGYPDYIDDELFIDDENAAEGDQLYERAVDIVIQAGKASAGYLQRRLKIGYNRAARLIDRMEEQGLIIPVIQKE